MDNLDQKFKEQGVVRRILGNGLALVEIKQTSACRSCGICAPIDEKTMSVEAVNSVNALVGRTVLISVSESNVLRAGVIVYVIPIVFMFIGLFAGVLIGGKDATGVQIAFAFGAFLASFSLVRFMGKKYNDIKYKPEISEILD